MQFRGANETTCPLRSGGDRRGNEDLARARVPLLRIEALYYFVPSLPSRGRPPPLPPPPSMALFVLSRSPPIHSLLSRHRSLTHSGKEDIHQLV